MLGFPQVLRYTAGKADWLANGLPVEEGESQAHARNYAHTDAPTCRLTEHIGLVRERVSASGWKLCAVVNEVGVVLGALGVKELAENAERTVEEVMDCAPRTYRLDASPDKILEYLNKQGQDEVLVTTSDGEFYGVIRREDIEA